MGQDLIKGTFKCLKVKIKVLIDKREELALMDIS